MTDLAESNATVMRETSEAVMARDTATFWDNQADDVRARVHGQGPVSGDSFGKGAKDWIPCNTFAELHELDQEAPRHSKDPATRLITVLADDEYAVAVYSLQTRDGSELGSVIAKVADGKLTQVWHHDPMTDTGPRRLVAAVKP
ncbi:hypothetical protein ACI780_11765 [Geodermatophilus sp. SYSU D00814]